MCQSSIVWWNCWQVPVHTQMMLFWRGTSKGIPWVTRFLFPLHLLAQAGLGRRPCSALDAVCTLLRLLVTLVKMVRNCLHVPFAAMDVRALWKMNKWFVRSLPLSNLGIREVLRLVSHLGLVFLLSNKYFLSFETSLSVPLQYLLEGKSHMYAHAHTYASGNSTPCWTQTFTQIFFF